MDNGRATRDENIVRVENRLYQTARDMKIETDPWRDHIIFQVYFNLGHKILVITKTQP